MSGTSHEVPVPAPSVEWDDEGAKAEGKKRQRQSRRERSLCHVELAKIKRQLLAIADNCEK